MTELEGAAATDPTHVLKHNWANEKLLKEDSYGFLSIHRASPNKKWFFDQRPFTTQKLNNHQKKS